MKKKWQGIRDIAFKAYSKFNEGDVEAALILLDEAIHLAEEQGLSVVDLRIQRERLTPKNTQDFSKVLNFIQRAAEDYKQQGDTLNQIQMLQQLAEVSFRYLNETSDALLIIDQAESLIASITSEKANDIANKYPKFDTAFIKNLLAIRRGELTKLRNTIEMRRDDQDKS